MYASTVTADDANVGKVLRAVDESNQACNTLILFASDNGAQNQGDAFSSSAPPPKMWRTFVFHAQTEHKM